MTTSMGKGLQVDFRTWDDRMRHFGSIVVIIAAAVLLAIGIALQVFARSVADVALWPLVGLVGVLLVYEALAVTWGLRPRRGAASADEPDAFSDSGAGEAAAAAGATSPWAPRPARAEAADAEPEAAPDPYAAPADPYMPPGSRAAPPSPWASPDAGPQVLTLRCGECQTVFDVQDSGVRPLYHVCPGCGAEGVLRGESAAARTVDPARPVGDLARKDEWSPPDLPEPKQIKLRCGACKHVFQLTDTGERPLRHRCPSCGKLGEIR